MFKTHTNPMPRSSQWLPWPTTGGDKLLQCDSCWQSWCDGWIGWYVYLVLGSAWTTKKDWWQCYEYENVCMLTTSALLLLLSPGLATRLISMKNMIDSTYVWRFVDVVWWHNGCGLSQHGNEAWLVLYTAPGHNCKYDVQKEDMTLCMWATVWFSNIRGEKTDLLKSTLFVAKWHPQYSACLDWMQDCAVHSERGDCSWEVLVLVNFDVILWNDVSLAAALVLDPCLLDEHKSWD